MVAGLVALLCALYEDAAPSEVIAIEPQIWEKCGLVKVLSPTRLQGLAAVRQRLRALATAWVAGPE
jgi:cysteine desulfuration protein SufE